MPPKLSCKTLFCCQSPSHNPTGVQAAEQSQLLYLPMVEKSLFGKLGTSLGVNTQSSRGRDQL